MLTKGLLGFGILTLAMLVASEAPAKPRTRSLPSPGAPVPAEVRQELLDGSTAFALELHSRLAEEGGNLVFSPLGVSTTAGMLTEAARGETREQLVGLLHLDPEVEPLGPAFRSVLSELGSDSTRDVQFRVASALWTRKEFRFERAFVDALREEFGARAASLDFARNPDRARKAINAWGRRQTGGLVPEVLPPESITRDTAFVVTNAVTLRAKWEVPFPSLGTYPMPFTLTDGTEIQVPTMYLRWGLPHHREEGFDAIELHYRGGEFSMLLLIPDAYDRLPALEAALTPSLLTEVAGNVVRKNLVLQLPRFSIASDLDLEKSFQSLGATVPFDPVSADFSAAAGLPGEIYLSVLRQKAVIQVNEAGTVAAAVTAGGGEFTSAPPVIAANCPFLFLIRHRATGTILFMGRVVDPR